jgi:hypothetical protein
MLMIKKLAINFSKIVPGEVSWPLGPAGKLFLDQEKKKVGPP